METMQGGGLRGGNDPLGGTARWPHAPGGLPSAYDQAFHRADDEEPVFGRGTMKRNSQHYVEQAAGRAAGVRLTAMHAASSAAAAAHAPSAYPASAYAPSAYPASAYAPYAVAGKENTYGAALSSKVAPPLLSPRGLAPPPPCSPRYGSSLGSQLAATSSSQPHPQPQPPPPSSGSHLNPSLAARRAAPPHAGLSAREPGAPQLRPTGKWSINDEQMHQPWGKVLRNLGQPR